MFYYFVGSNRKEKKMSIQIEDSWKVSLDKAFQQKSFAQLKNFLLSERAAKLIYYPAGNQIFEAFNQTPFDKVKVVLLGQDPYHGPGQAHGLSFSVNDGVPFPPSLKNIFKALQVDYPGYEIPKNGNLTHWARQGVLLLNATLTVRANEAGSHQKKGWEEFTDEVIRMLNLERTHLVFMLWGAYAQSKSNLIDSSKHLVLKAVHPSPLSAHRGFFECKHFSLCNKYLEENEIPGIEWTFPKS
jgi:uracil-DNA glycosylase